MESPSLFGSVVNSFIYLLSNDGLHHINNIYIYIHTYIYIYLILSDTG